MLAIIRFRVSVFSCHSVRSVCVFCRFDYQKIILVVRECLGLIRYKVLIGI
jgi:hypothetical protein